MEPRQDDASALDYPTTHAWTMLMRLFVAEYLELDLNRASKGRGFQDEDEDEDEGWADDSWLRERDELVSCPLRVGVGEGGNSG